MQDINFIEAASVQAATGSQRPHFAKTCQRSLTISGFPDHCSLAEITTVLRGGLLLIVHMRPTERCAFVSFLHEEHAVAFLQHVKTNGLYIRKKSVSVHWADRQYYLPGHVAYQIRGGATRNLVIRRCDPKHTETSVRDDLEHIHNLVAISVEFIGGSCYIRTNSVMNAIFARTCMTSRAKYKGSSITFDVDECAQPLEVQPRPFRLQKTCMPQAASGPMTKSKTQNRFAALRVDDKDDLEESFTDNDENNSDSDFISPGSSASTN
ncbi:hypothetical protein Micbo1qcDRAFT_159585 [Microdochium bolleyi]|uniref:RRM domain-containing protein n=1 Tax=Microdochium bolleyi TaxID=196109 RepID=A0A136JBE8_9PEZI|nr:hypothetical protein Micbo1qcDRAFT_159585 [Microdochium bolleyi]